MNRNNIEASKAIKDPEISSQLNLIIFITFWIYRSHLLATKQYQTLQLSKNQQLGKKQNQHGFHFSNKQHLKQRTPSRSIRRSSGMKPEAIKTNPYTITTPLHWQGHRHKTEPTNNPQASHYNTTTTNRADPNPR
ncbi:hypothetical protein MLD38_013207 [Melastoma candidum]|uniref:Uncharacterized protein n=1 Tax=Melastoma candidum TaxID=119954 RepID=A0ACB9R8W8_9MYRT|nr:hypothetical protein MLD38_013207 [Melastoma candidum]